MRLEHDLKIYAKKAREVLNDFELYPDDDILVTFNNRLSRALGRCCYTHDYLTGLTVPRRIEIRTDCFLSVSVSDLDIMNILIHEYLHACFPYDGHNGQWLYWANVISNNSEYTIQKYSYIDTSKFESYNYAAFCPKCNKILKGFKSKATMIKNASHYRHTVCNSCLVGLEYKQALLIENQYHAPIEIQKDDSFSHSEQLSLFD